MAMMHGAAWPRRRPRGLAAGDVVRVQGPRGCVPRVGVIMGIRSCESVSTGRVLVVRWKDDGTITSLLPGIGIDVIGAEGL